MMGFFYNYIQKKFSREHSSLQLYIRFSAERGGLLTPSVSREGLAVRTPGGENSIIPSIEMKEAFKLLMEYSNELADETNSNEL